MKKTNGGAEGPRTVIHSVHKSLRLLKYIASAEREVGIAELQRQFGFSSSTIHHLLQTLMLEGFVSQNTATKKYEIGPEFLYMTMAHKHFEKFFARALPILGEIREETGETTILFIQSGVEAVAVLGQESAKTIRARLRIGRKIPLHCTATGKTFLAYLPEETVKNILVVTGLPGYEKNTITSEEELFAELARIRRRGFAFEFDEYEDMINALGFPVFNAEGKIFAAVCVVGPSGRLTGEAMEAMGPGIRSQVDRISTVLASPYY
ncbi:MAG: IclR family transcriptional regulator [Firmicutes bacterium]|nr:IclR family transcriptional regulator [Bacillota bacterium]